MIKIITLFFLSSCAYLHRIDIGEIEARSTYVKVPFEINASTTGIDIQNVGTIVKEVYKSSASQISKHWSDAIALFQMGPRTGFPVYRETFADNILSKIYQICPSGNVTGLVGVREMNNYFAISGEIVKVQGFCLKKKTKRKNK